MPRHAQGSVDVQRGLENDLRIGADLQVHRPQVPVAISLVVEVEGEPVVGAVPRKQLDICRLGVITTLKNSILLISMVVKTAIFDKHQVHLSLYK